MSFDGLGAMASVIVPEFILVIDCFDTMFKCKASIVEQKRLIA